jgi:hypothetical protein
MLHAGHELDIPPPGYSCGSRPGKYRIRDVLLIAPQRIELVEAVPEVLLQQLAPWSIGHAIHQRRVQTTPASCRTGSMNGSNRLTGSPVSL